MVNIWPGLSASLLVLGEGVIFPPSNHLYENLKKDIGHEKRYPPRIRIRNTDCMNTGPASRYLIVDRTPSISAAPHHHDHQVIVLGCRVLAQLRREPAQQLHTKYIQH